ncbi:hypothetical protein EAH79_16405 [Sphingomonas koreensis]|nr:hypothetical protein EAH79_16405 [Sphingomonas koreensis]
MTGTGTHHGEGFYAAADIPVGKFDLLIVDGPQSFAGQNRLARNGFADIFMERLSENFIIIVDDAERSGESKLIKRMRARLKDGGIAYKEGEALAMKRQKLFCGGEFVSAAYF